MKKLFGKLALVIMLVIGVFGAFNNIKQVSAAETSQEEKIVMGDQVGLQFLHYDNFETYKTKRDEYYNQDLEIAEEYYSGVKMLDIESLIECQYQVDLETARKFYFIWNADGSLNKKYKPIIIVAG